jgi:hypothetical protein
MHLTDEEVAMVLQAIQEGRIRGLDDVPYDPESWNEEAVRDWLEHNHTPSHARFMVTTLRAGKQVKSRPTPPTTDITTRALARHIAQMEREIAALRERLLDQA